MFYEERYSEVYLSATSGLREVGRGNGCVGLRARTLKEMHEVIDEANTINDVPSSSTFVPTPARRSSDGRGRASNDDIIVHRSSGGSSMSPPNRT